ncbi:MAG TPA: LuxR C-terminal-related transcriptional regulator [Chloroflexota bacterium]|nr:LuxR C-terminal-related transcriptional regulator [Chloroflexota bacterium]HUM67563.1 LuxR C-terminal-related transcriptional regulator [Chloroflexota bacterium]
MSDLLLQTKLFKPSLRPALINRTHLINRLNESLGIGTLGFAVRLVLVCAPAGFGKTTLVSAWLADLTTANPQFSGGVTAWLSLDESDNDPVRFLTYLIAALQTAVPGLGETAVKALQSPQPAPPETILTLLINEISQIDVSIVLVLDDYHVIAAPAIHLALSFLIEHLPPQLHLLITSRIDPALPLSRWRAHSQITEIRANDLRFTSDEVQRFFNQMMGLTLSNEEMAALEQRTEGWIVGLQLAALSLQGRTDQADLIAAFTGSHRFIIDYLTEEVLSQQSNAVREFLLLTSILERMCGPLSNALTQTESGQQMLEYLEHHNLFLIPLDDSRLWYRFHHLFAEVLRQRLQKVYPSSTFELYRRASSWFEQNELVSEAIEYALKGQDWPNAGRLIEANIDQAQLRGEVATLLRWLAVLPDETFQTHPLLALTHAWLLVITDEFTIAERRLATVEKIVRSDSTLDSSTQTMLLGQIAFVRTLSALMLEYPGELTVATGQEALALLPESDLARRGFVFFTIGCAEYIDLGDIPTAEQSFQQALSLSHAAGDALTELMTWAHLSQALMIQGQIQAAGASCEKILQRVAESDWERVPAVGLCKVMHGRILYEQNELQAAEETLTQGIAEVERYALTRPVILGYILLARVKQAQGQSNKARELLDHAWSVIQKYNLKQITIPVAAYRAKLLLAFGDLGTAVQWAREIEPTTHGSLNPALEYEHMAFVRVQMAQGRLVEAQQLLARLLPPAEAAGRVTRIIEMLLLQAVIAARLQDEAQAMASLERALVLGEPEGFVRSFVDEGEPLRLLLLVYRDQAKDHLLAYTNRLLAAFPLPGSQPTPQLDSFLDPLSDRELEVLRLVANGASNREIADELILAVTTVKKHVSNIMSKLNASSRTQAAAEARSLGLL